MSSYPLPTEFNELPKEAVYHSIPEYKGYCLKGKNVLDIAPFEELTLHDYGRGTVSLRNPGPGPAEISLPGGGEIRVLFGNIQFIINDGELRTGTASDLENSIINTNRPQPDVSVSPRRQEIFNTVLQHGLSLIDEFTTRASVARPVPIARPSHTTPDLPISLNLQNNNTTSGILTLFNSYTTRTAANHGNNNGLNVISNIPGVNYPAILAQSESKPKKINYIQLVILTGPWRHFIITPILFTRRDASGGMDRKTIWFTSGPPGTDERTLHAECPGEIIDGYTEMEFLMPASTSISIMFNPHRIEIIPPVNNDSEIQNLKKKLARQLVKAKRNR